MFTDRMAFDQGVLMRGVAFANQSELTQKQNVVMRRKIFENEGVIDFNDNGRIDTHDTSERASINDIAATKSALLSHDLRIQLRHELPYTHLKDLAAQRGSSVFTSHELADINVGWTARDPQCPQHLGCSLDYIVQTNLQMGFRASWALDVHNNEMFVYTPRT